MIDSLHIFGTSIIDKILLNKLYNVQLESDYKLIVISGSPRSGTTFLAETIANALDSMIIWEPLQDKILLKNKLDISKRPILSDIKYNEDFKSYLNNIANAENLNYYNTWVRNSLFRNKLYKKKHKYLIIKFTRGNGIIDYYNDKVNFTANFVILRNPFSVVASQIEHHEFKEHPIYSLNTSYLQIIKKVENSIKPSIVRDLAITWAVDYYNAKNSKAKKIIYQQLINDLNPLQKYLRTLIPDIEDVLSIKSSTFNNKTANNGNFRDKWRKTLSTSDVLIIKKVIGLFELESEINENFNIAL